MNNVLPNVLIKIVEFCVKRTTNVNLQYVFYVEHLLTFKKNNQNFFIIIVNNYEYIDLLYFKIKKIFFNLGILKLYIKKIINTMSIKYN